MNLKLPGALFAAAFALGAAHHFNRIALPSDAPVPAEPARVSTAVARSPAPEATPEAAPEASNDAELEDGPASNEPPRRGWWQRTFGN